jgi:hypothetical protein
MQLEIDCDPNEQEYVLAHVVIVRRTLTTALQLLLQSLHEADLKRGTFIGKGIDPAAMIESATKAQRAKDEHTATFGY